MHLRILQPTSWRHGRPDPWELYSKSQSVVVIHEGEEGAGVLQAAIGRTDNQGNHARAVTTSGLKPFDELLDLPYLDLNMLSVCIGEWTLRSVVV